jgi:hypothetical protein
MAQYVTGAKFPAIQDLYTRQSQAVMELQVWDQKAPEQLLPRLHKTVEQLTTYLVYVYFLNGNPEFLY